MRTLVLIALVLLPLEQEPPPASARAQDPVLVAEEVFKGTVSAVEDGDTLVVRTSFDTSMKLHLEGADAPEMSQPGGFEARATLAELALNEPVTVRLKNVVERLARVEADGADVSLALVRRGMAWHCPRYTRDRDLASAEAEARGKKRGLWAAARPTPPWLHRGAGVCWQEAGRSRRDVPDFSGSWTAVSPPRDAGRTITITQDATHVVIEHALDGVPEVWSWKLEGLTSLALSGADGPIDVVAKSRWEGGALVVDERTWAVRGQEAASVRRTFWLDDRGFLNVETARPRPLGELDATVLVLRRDAPRPRDDRPGAR